jgi:hypothetical protein
MYYIVDGEEKTTHYYTENQFITSFRSFINKILSDHYLQCIEDFELAPITDEIEQKLLKKYPKLESFARVVFRRRIGQLPRYTLILHYFKP